MEVEFDDPTVRRQLAGFALVVAALAAVTVLVTPQTVLDRIQSVSEKPLVFGVVVALLYLFRPLVAWPVTLLAAVVGYGYGVALGIPIALAGAVGTCAMPYLFARYMSDGGGVFGWLGESGGAVFDVTGSTRGVVVARLVPIPSDIVSYAAGVSGVPLRSLLVGTAIGELPWTVVAVLAGSSMSRLTAKGASAVDWRLVAAAVLGALLLVAGPVHRHLNSE